MPERESLQIEPLEVSIEEKETKLKQKLLLIQLQYAQRLFERKIPSPSNTIDIAGMDFKQMLEEFTDLSTRVRDNYFKRTGNNFGSKENWQEFEKLNKEITEKVFNAYTNDPDNWTDRVDSLILETINQLPLADKVSQEINPEEFRAGVLRYSVGAGHSGLEDYGISIDDECIKTHLDPLFKQEEIPEGKKLSDLYKEAYKIIAREVKEKYPNAKALASQSWLFDTALAKEVGLHIYPSSNENSFRGTAFWGQFINREGQVNEERVRQLLETGKPPFRVKSGYIPIEEFFKKYLEQE